ncbi:hypothetical protein GCM10020331_038910 [Ectobacillus funiculus]
MFELLYQTLHYLDEGVDPEIFSAHLSNKKMLPVLGFYPQWDACSICGRDEQLTAFSVREGGFLCQLHAKQDPYCIPVNEAVGKLLRLFLSFLI